MAAPSFSFSQGTPSVHHNQQPPSQSVHHNTHAQHSRSQSAQYPSQSQSQFHGTHSSTNNANASNHHNNTTTAQPKRRNSRSSRRIRSTRVFVRGYNFNYQLGLGNNENYSSEMIELPWCKGSSICYVCGGLTHSCYLSLSGQYYFSGQMDPNKLGITQSTLNNEMITYSKPTKIYEFLPNTATQNQQNHSNSNHTNTSNNAKHSNKKRIVIQRIADGISARHMIVISDDYTAYSMGDNQRGQLALGHYNSMLSFSEIHIPLSNSDTKNLIELDVIDASCGNSHSAFVAMPKCSQKVKTIVNFYFNRYAFKFLNNLNRETYIEIETLICNYVYSNGKGRIYVSGCNNYGQLGLGAHITEPINIPQWVLGTNTQSSHEQQSSSSSSNLLGAVSIAQVSCGEHHTLCLDNRGRVYCWGDNYYGQSGHHDNHYHNVYLPDKITHFKTRYKAKIVKVSSGKYHCVALDKIGRVFCWGLGAYGQLGTPKLTKRIIFPKLVESLQNIAISDVRCGIYHTVALSRDGVLYCWGSNNYGQCFQNVQKENIIIPTIAKFDFKIPKIYKVFCGYYSTLVVTVDEQEHENRHHNHHNNSHNSHHHPSNNGYK